MFHYVDGAFSLVKSGIVNELCYCEAVLRGSRKAIPGETPRISPASPFGMVSNSQGDHLSGAAGVVGFIPGFYAVIAAR